MDVIEIEIEIERESESSKEHCAGINDIDSLPDSLHIEILSLLPTVDAYRTSFVSTRWRRLWKSILNLNFTTDLINPNPGFAPFIDRLLSLHDASPTTSLRFAGQFYEPVIAPSVDSWVHFAADHGAQELDLSLLPPTPSPPELNFHKLPRRLFECRSLRKLVLCCCELNLCGPVEFPALCSLDLILVRFDSAMIEALIAGSPRLRSLHMENCVVAGELKIVDFNGHLSYLTIAPLASHSSKIEIVVPRLKFLHIVEFMPQAGVRVIGCFDLGCAMLDFKKMLEYSYVLEERNWHSNLVELISDLSNARSLKLCSWCLQVFTIWGRETLGARSLTRPQCLFLNSFITEWEIPGIVYLLKIFGPVKKLYICFEQKQENLPDAKIEIDTPAFDEDEFLRPEGLPLVALKHLETIDIYGFLKEEDIERERGYPMNLDKFFESRENEITLVKFLLANSNALKRMSFRYPFNCYFGIENVDGDLLSALSQKLKSFSRASPEVETRFH